MSEFFQIPSRCIGQLFFLLLCCCWLQASADSKDVTAERPTVRIVLFTPSDIPAPAGAPERLTQIANATEKFLFSEMNRCGYPPGAKALFQRHTNGQVEVLNIRGDLPKSSGKYAKPGFVPEITSKAKNQHHVGGEADVWWVFVYLGDRPARFENFFGGGGPREGGRAVVNYDTFPGEIQADLGPAEGFNGQVFLKGMIHELGHAFGLPHMGPDPALGLGNSLMGPTIAAYTRAKGAHPELTYLNDASAAMLWKHPIFAGAGVNHLRLPELKLADYEAKYCATNDAVTISGKLIANQPAHSVVLFDDTGKPRDEYWVQSHAARLGADGLFRIKISKPVKVSGHYRIVFCFDNGLVTGDGQNIGSGNWGAIKKFYSFQNGEFQFEK